DPLAGGGRARPRRWHDARRGGGRGHAAARAGDRMVRRGRAGSGAHGRRAVRSVSRDPRVTARSHRRTPGRMRLHSVGEGWAIARLPEIHYAAIWTQLFHRFEYGGSRTQTLALFGADDRFMEILGGGISRGRVFTPAERRTGAPVIIVEQRTVDRLFGPLDPVSRLIKVGGRPFRVIGVYQRPTNIFELPGAPEIAGIVPFETARRNFKFDEVNGLIILVRPVDGVGVPRAMDAVTLQLRRVRGI